jgi:hypothetical protein
MPLKRAGYIVSEDALKNWLSQRGVSIPQPPHPQYFIIEIDQAFDAYPHNLGPRFMDVFPTGTISVPSKNGTGNETMYFFVRAERDSEYGDEAYKKAYWAEKESDRRVKKVLEAVLGTELSPWFQKLYL